jgi:hypothetical protein
MPITVSPKAETALVTVVTVEDPYTFDEWVAATTPLLSSGPDLSSSIEIEPAFA